MTAAIGNFSASQIIKYINDLYNLRFSTNLPYFIQKVNIFLPILTPHYYRTTAKFVTTIHIKCSFLMVDLYGAQFPPHYCVRFPFLGQWQLSGDILDSISFIEFNISSQSKSPKNALFYAAAHVNMSILNSSPSKVR